jgi:IS4 transposase
MHGGMVLSREARGSAEALPSREVRSRAVGYVTVRLAPYLGLKLVYRGTWSTGYRQ